MGIHSRRKLRPASPPVWAVYHDWERGWPRTRRHELGQGVGGFAGPAGHVEHDDGVEHVAGVGVVLAGHVVYGGLPGLQGPAEQGGADRVHRGPPGRGAGGGFSGQAGRYL